MKGLVGWLKQFAAVSSIAILLLFLLIWTKRDGGEIEALEEEKRLKEARELEVLFLLPSLSSLLLSCLCRCCYLDYVVGFDVVVYVFCHHNQHDDQSGGGEKVGWSLSICEGPRRSDRRVQQSGPSIHIHW